MSLSAQDGPTPWDSQLGREWQPPDPPPTDQPHPLRMWDYMVGGKDNYQIDRDAAEAAIKFVPNIVFAARAGEAFIIRAQSFIARPEHGIDQFLHLGCYIPKLNSPSLSGLARAGRPGTRYVFVTDDQVSAAHARAVLAARAPAGTEVHARWADFREPAPILADPWLSERIDLSRPVGLLLLGMIDFIADEDRLARALTELRAALAPGSMIVMVHLLEGTDPSASEQALREALGHNPFQYRPRSLERVRQLVADFEFVDPGFVPCTSWRPDGRGPGQDLEARCAVAGGVAIVR
ncbi:MAG TPA: SAM-dependent methyltransferase [Actinospica sp.]|nr:SAM-dependent methyltransferase [Actinospica sp.]